MDKFLKLWEKYSFILLVAFVLLGVIDLRFAVVAVICMLAPIIIEPGVIFVLWEL